MCARAWTFTSSNDCSLSWKGDGPVDLTAEFQSAGPRLKFVAKVTKGSALVAKLEPHCACGKRQLNQHIGNRSDAEAIQALRAKVTDHLNTQSD